MKASDVLDAYQRRSGDKAMTQREFSKRLSERNFEGKRGTGGRVFYRGIGLQDPPSDAASEGSEAF